MVGGLCASVLLWHKNQRMNLLQHILSLILHRGHAEKQVNVTFKIQIITNSSVSQAKLVVYMIVICAYMHAPRTISCAHIVACTVRSYVSLINEPMVFLDELGKGYDKEDCEWRDKPTSAIDEDQTGIRLSIMWNHRYNSLLFYLARVRRKLSQGAP